MRLSKEFLQEFFYTFGPPTRTVTPPLSTQPQQTFAWSTKMSWSVSTRLPYVVEVCEETFVKMNDLLERVGEGLAEDRIPSQEQECMVVAGLNLLRLQAHVGSSLAGRASSTCCQSGQQPRRPAHNTVKPNTRGPDILSCEEVPDGHQIGRRDLDPVS
ncbi:E3 ubiquitin-protein ligase HERC2 [Chionoecetes opilio]|uniref:E3 ubiquitin-protein ligase HERC2 n=1 Tax=Chionoecetes opilio TaxID=41210 RepID=A0A8J4XR44_CHIOP|nr:E3 ubiquitin-protein ligase HERC2 [Chionoecetes opilio]